MINSQNDIVRTCAAYWPHHLPAPESPISGNAASKTFRYRNERTPPAFATRFTTAKQRKRNHEQVIGSINKSRSRSEMISQK